MALLICKLNNVKICFSRLSYSHPCYGHPSHLLSFHLKKTPSEHIPTIGLTNKMCSADHPSKLTN